MIRLPVREDSHRFVEAHAMLAEICRLPSGDPTRTSLRECTGHLLVAANVSAVQRHGPRDMVTRPRRMWRAVPAATASWAADDNGADSFTGLWRPLFNERISVAMKEFPSASILAKNLCCSQSSLSRRLIADTRSFLSLDPHGESQVSTDSDVKVLHLHCGAGFMVLRRRPVVTRTDRFPALFTIATKPAEYCGVGPVRGILFPQGGIAIDETRLRFFPLTQECAKARVGTCCWRGLCRCAGGESREKKKKEKKKYFFQGVSSR